MVVLAIGDVVGSAGCDYLEHRLPELVREYKVDIVIANGENAAEGNGILPHSATQLWKSGVDIITLGNHGLRRREIYDLLDSGAGIVRPANYHPEAPGIGVFLYDAVNFQLCVINLQGSIYMNTYENPFTCVERLLPELPTKHIIVDFHAEATSEKLCMGSFLDGKVSAVIGTHTHVPTADAQILPNGTGYITDLGMCGGKHSILGVEPQGSLYRMRTGLPTRFVNDKRDIALSGVLLELHPQTGLCTAIQSLTFV